MVCRGICKMGVYLGIGGGYIWHDRCVIRNYAVGGIEKS